MIIDTHQHFWHVGQPWEKSPDDYRVLASTSGVTGTILRLWETQIALDLAADEPLIVGVCGQIKSGPQFAAELEKFSANPLFRGICYLGRELVEAEKASLYGDMERLADKDLQLDLLRVCPGFFGGPRRNHGLYGTGSEEAFEAMLRLAKRVSKLRIVVEHIGGMAIDGKPIQKSWEEMFRRMAEHPQIYVKVSGLMGRATTRARGERATEVLSYYRPALDALWEIFGEDRLFYGSDWPVSEHVGDFIVNGLRIVTPYFAEKGELASRKFFWMNSKKIYKWEARLPSQR